jgi:hypothetical protein
MKIKASKAVPGQWYEDGRGNRLLHAYGWSFYKSDVGWIQLSQSEASLTYILHLPDCTGWDWQPPKPPKRYRAFASFEEWWPHRERWMKNKTGQVFRLGWIASNTAEVDFLEGIVFLNDDGSDGEPFGVEVSE